MEPKWFIYELNGAPSEAEVGLPYEDLHKLGFEWDTWRAETIADQIWIRATKYPATYPDYIGVPKW